MASLNYKTEDGWKKVSGGKTGVLTFKGRAGVVTPKEGDYTAEMVGARPNTWMPNIAEVGGVNPNILDNWYFMNLVNQRGQTEYACGVNQYFADRWIGTYISAVLGSSGITMTATGSANFNFYQKIEHSERFAGKTLTFSFLCDDVAGSFIVALKCTRSSTGTATQTIKVAKSQTTGGLVTVTAPIPDDITVLMPAVYLPNGSSLRAIAAKLELGSTQTLAHQDADGNWVLNEIPDYGEELRKCQRYQLQIKAGQMFPARLWNGGLIWGNLSTPVTMAKNPAIKENPLFTIVSGNEALSFESTLSSNTAIAYPSAVEIVIAYSTDISIGNVLIIANSDFILDANL